MDIDVFISHHTKSSLHIVEGIVNKLESVGIRCWYAPRDTEGAYASSIAKAINNCAIFLLILNRPASESFHVLNEIDMVTKRLTRSEDVKVIPFHVADDEIGEDAQYYLGRMHWIDAMTPPMYQRIDELVEHISRLLGKEIPETTVKAEESAPRYQLIDKLPQARDVFDGRDHLIEQIHQEFAGGKRAVFLEGIGGIGKSELAKQFALRYQKEYNHILFVTYATTLEKLFGDATAIVIENLEAQPEEDEAAYFLRKLNVLQSITDEKTLIIVDNFDVDDDSRLKEFLTGNYRVIFTTRNAHPGYASIKVGAIEDMEVLKGIFEQNYGDSLMEEDMPFMEEIFRLIEFHTYTIELIAKQMEASFLSAQEMLELLKQGQLNEAVSETVAGRKDRKTAFAHICSVFNTSNLDEEEKRLLMYLSMMGTQGVLAVRFKEWAELDSFETVNQLVRKSWIRKEAGQRLSIHPLVKEVVYHMLNPGVENCRSFLENLAAYCFGAWGRPYKENVAIGGNVLAVLEYFKIPDGNEIEIFEPFCSLLWQIGLFDDSIRFGHLLYDACVQACGINSMVAGYAAKALGGDYFNSRHLKESIPWYKQGLESMLRSGAKESEDLAMSYEKVARCCTWEYAQDFAKAEEYFQKALDIRLRLREALKRGEKREMLMKNEHYGIEKAEARIGESYMEMGRMYQMMGNYEKGLEFAALQEDILVKYNPKDVSGRAYSRYDQGVCYYHLGMQAQAKGNMDAAKEQWTKAASNLELALESNLKMRGGLAVDTIDNQEYLADTYAALERYGEASNGYMAVVTMIENLFGKDHPRIQTVKEKMNFSR